MRVLIGGGTGFIGQHLCHLLQENGYRVTVISRTIRPDGITWTDIHRHGLPKDCTSVVNVAGENILNVTKRWNDSFKEQVKSSRVETNKLLAKAISEAENPPESFVTISGVAYYKPSETEEYTEESPGGGYDWLSTLTTEWEAAATLPDSMNVRRVTVRSGVVLGKDGGMIQQIFFPFFLGFGGRMGTGKQWFPWIHIDDIAGILAYAVKNKSVYGILNGVAPGTATNAQFASAFAGAMWRPAIFPMPSLVFNTVFGKERGKIILEGQKVIPKRTLECGYKYKYPDLKSACHDLSSIIGWFGLK
ncbi:hypothetical protein CHS0354_034805 [Potamilus streckersoni]|uniref:Epimerase family protein SDR39U1 n=1 Tax=Potamilus streckersoni TaxID=2493646 RepID=A0AAE0RSQ7_9BIVA|nr:hypothetical protein CHS0354_034805 [Potamilus streckersoni]